VDQPGFGAGKRGLAGLFLPRDCANLGEQDLILLFIYAFSFYLQTKLNPVTDPAQAEQQRIMAIMMPALTFVMMLQWQLPSAFVLYWFLSNALSVGQQWYMRRVDPPRGCARRGG
jgi:membrane protein insertase Oxa1/YidC/SpoIIIJ